MVLLWEEEEEEDNEDEDLSHPGLWVLWL